MIQKLQKMFYSMTNKNVKSAFIAEIVEKSFWWSNGKLYLIQRFCIIFRAIFKLVK